MAAIGSICANQALPGGGAVRLLHRVRSNTLWAPTVPSRAPAPRAQRPVETKGRMELGPIEAIGCTTAARNRNAAPVAGSGQTDSWGRSIRSDVQDLETQPGYRHGRERRNPM